jgi:glutathione S-transferase
LLGDLFRSLQPRYLSRVADAVQSNFVQGMTNVNIDAFCNTLDGKISTWEQLEEQLGPITNDNDQPSARSTTRLFGKDKPVVTLYRDSAAWCPYCQKVWIALEEKQVPYEIVKIDMRCYGEGKPSEFLRLQPNGNLPCAIVDRGNTGLTEVEIIRESNDIIDALDELSTAKNTPTLRPAGQDERIRDLCDNGRESLERRLYARWMWWLTGIRRPQEYKDLFLEHWQEVEDALGETHGPYFLGKELSVVDLRFIPFVERQLASLAYFKGADYLRDATQYPNLVRWLEAMESRASYQATKSDYYTHSRALPPQLAAECAAEPGCEDLQAAIDSLPTMTNDGTMSDWVEPGWEWTSPNINPAKEAAERLIQGRDKIVVFSARGAGLAGLPVASAPLADPAATPNEAAIPALDLLLRHLAMSLLQKSSRRNNNWFSIGTTQSSSTSSLIIQEGISRLGDDRSAQALADCLDYLRARIGVPRDMSYPAAQELRRELLGVSNILRVGAEASSSPKEVVEMETV